MYNIAIIGVGQLGSRHLQGLAKISTEIAIQVVDPSLESLKIAEERFNQIPPNKNVTSISFISSIVELTKKLDLVIIATNSDVRLPIVKELVTSKEVTNLVLEKIAFQSVEDFQEALSLIQANKINAWVNCNRRMFEFYSQLKNELKSQKFSMSIQAGEWGLACNAIHYIDLFCFLSDSSDNLEIKLDFLDPKLYESKRKGFVELNGQLSARVGNNILNLFSNSNSKAGALFTISASKANYIIDEASGLVQKADEQSEWKFNSQINKIVSFQSELTNTLAENILLNNSCKLPTIEESYKLHAPFLQEVLLHINKFGLQHYNNCPIT